MKKDIDLNLRKIIALGALWSEESGFSTPDMIYFHHTQDVCEKIGLPFRTPLDIFAVNKIYGHDALDPRSCYPGDVVVSCLVNDFKRSDREIAGSGQRNQESPFHRKRRAWYRFAARSNAKIVAVVSDYCHCDEITAAHFAGRRFVKGPEKIFSEMVAFGLTPPELYAFRLETLVRRDVARALGL